LVAKKPEENLGVIREMKGVIVSCFLGYLNSDCFGGKFRIRLALGLVG
jgi:hypothetical protein